MDKIPKLIQTVVAVIVASGLAATVLLAQGDLDALRQAAEQGDAEAQYSLGYRYATGVGVSQDYAEAARWLRLAAEQGPRSSAASNPALLRRCPGLPTHLVRRLMS